LHNWRLSIRPWLRQDDDIADEWPPYNDPFDVIWNLPRSGLLPLSWGSSFDLGGYRRCWAVENRLGDLMGRISLREIDERRGQARLGVTFAAPYVSQGYGTDSLRMFFDYYFSDLGFVTMVLDVAAVNVRAVRCYERLGFVCVGSDWRTASGAFDNTILNDPRYAYLRRHFRLVPRGWQSEFLEMQLKKSEWLALRRSGI
jgi:RimJ/RimL family protein N-acetyltransferase